MMIKRINHLEDEALKPFSSLTEAQLKREDKGLFIAESPKVIRVALQAGLKPKAMLCEEKHITGDAADLLPLLGNISIYTGTRELLSQLTGYTLTRGVLCAMHRPILPSADELLQKAKRVAVIHGVVDSTNIGAIFRSAAAMGVDCLLITKNSCDPLNRRAIRVSMGTVFLLPWTWVEEDPIRLLRDRGFATAAMALSDHSIPLDDPKLKKENKLAIILGTEGDGLPQEAIDKADYTVRIPMYHQVDSLNVAAAAAVAFWELRSKAHQ